MIRGSEAALAVCDEDTYGVAPTTPSTRLIKFTSLNPKYSRAMENDSTIVQGRGVSEPQPGRVDVTGSIEQVVSSEQIGFLLRHAIGGTVTSTGTGSPEVAPYTHVLETGDLPVGFCADVDYGDSLTSGRYEQFNGMRVGEMSVSVPETGFCTASFSLVGAGSSLEAAPLDATPTEYTHQGIMSDHAVILYDGAESAIITTASVSYSNNLDTSVYTLRGNGSGLPDPDTAARRACLPEGVPSLTGSITALFTNEDFLEAARTGDKITLAIVLANGTGAGTEGNGYLKLEMRNAKLEPTSAEVTTGAGIKLTFNFMCWSTSAEPLLKATLKNTQAALT
jgi:hypothetical protein